MAIPPFDDYAPNVEELTAYDERHLATYVLLLDAAEEDADWRELARVVFGLDAAREPKRARLVHASHLARARWITEKGYRYLVAAHYR